MRKGGSLAVTSDPAAAVSVRPRVALVQDGARGRYALALALQQAGILDRMYTDWFIRRGSLLERCTGLLERFLSSKGRRMLQRRCEQLAGHRVVTNPLMLLRQEMLRRRLNATKSFYAWQSEDVGRWLRRRGLGQANLLAGYIRNLAPALCAYAQEKGLKTVGDQIIAPAAVEMREARIQNERFPGWEPADHSAYYEAMSAFERRTWEHLDAVTCASEYVRQGLIDSGVSAERIRLIHYPSGEHNLPPVDRSGRKGPLTVGFVGAVNLRKGAPYFFQVARRFSPRHVRFVMVGPVGLNPRHVQENQGGVELVGGVGRSEVTKWLEQFDVFFFPSTCEGSALSIMEAMAAGLPVVTSPNSGTVARHGIEGFLAPYDDIDAYAGYLEKLAADEPSRLAMGRAAAARHAECDLANYADGYRRLFEELLNPSRA